MEGPAWESILRSGPPLSSQQLYNPSDHTKTTDENHQSYVLLLPASSAKNGIRW